MMMRGGVIILFGFLVLQSAFLSAESEAQSPSSAANERYIVLVSKTTTQGESPRDRCLRILSSVFPSQKAAEDAMVYVYKFIPGCVGAMTYHQATLLKDQPEVLHVVRDIKFNLDFHRGGLGE